MSNSKERPRFGPFLILGLFFVIYYGLPLSWKIATQSAFDEFNAPFWNITSRLSDLSDYWGHQADSKKTLISKNRDLARIRADWNINENHQANWERELTKIRQNKAHLTRLRNEIGFDSEQNYSPVLARVTRRNLPSWWQELYLRKGMKDGIQTGMGVLYAGGIAGRINNSRSGSSSVELATNPSFRIAAHFANDERPVTFQGSGILVGGQPIGLVLDVPHDIEANENQPILLQTSEFGGTFPRGITIGTVNQLVDSGDGLFKTGRVYMSSTLNRVSEVTVLIPSSGH